jgi:hypothetical protein
LSKQNSCVLEPFADAHLHSSVEPVCSE